MYVFLSGLLYTKSSKNWEQKSSLSPKPLTNLCMWQSSKHRLIRTGISEWPVNLLLFMGDVCIKMLKCTWVFVCKPRLVQIVQSTKCSWHVCVCQSVCGLRERICDNSDWASSPEEMNGIHIMCRMNPVQMSVKWKMCDRDWDRMKEESKSDWRFWAIEVCVCECDAADWTTIYPWDTRVAPCSS